MLVKYWMQPKVETIEAEDSMENAIKLMKQNEGRLLPVTRQGRLVGVVTDRDRLVLGEGVADVDAPMRLQIRALVIHGLQRLGLRGHQP